MWCTTTVCSYLSSPRTDAFTITKRPFSPVTFFVLKSVLSDSTPVLFWLLWMAYHFPFIYLQLIRVFKTRVCLVYSIDLGHLKNPFSQSQPFNWSVRSIYTERVAKEVGFTPAISLSVFCMSYFFLLYSSITAFFTWNRYFPVCHFNSFVISLTNFFS